MAELVVLYVYVLVLNKLPRIFYNYTSRPPRCPISIPVINSEGYYVIDLNVLGHAVFSRNQSLLKCSVSESVCSSRKKISKPTEPLTSSEKPVALGTSSIPEDIYKTTFVSETHGGATVGDQWKVVLAG